MTIKTAMTSSMFLGPMDLPRWSIAALKNLGLLLLLLGLVAFFYCYFGAGFYGVEQNLPLSLYWSFVDWWVWLFALPIMVNALIQNDDISLPNTALIEQALKASWMVPIAITTIRCGMELVVVYPPLTGILSLAYKRLPLNIGIWALITVYILWAKLRFDTLVTFRKSDGSAACKEERLPSQKLKVHRHHQEFYLSPEDVFHIKASGNYLELNDGKQTYLMRATMKTLEASQQLSSLIRCHRSYMVNLKHIQAIKLNNAGNHDLLLTDGKYIPLSKGYRDKVKAQLMTVSA